MSTATGTETQQAKLALAGQFYASIFNGDWDFITQNTTEDFAVVEAASLPYGGDWKGVAGFQQLFAAMATEHYEDMQVEQKALMANDDYVMAYFSLSGKVRKTGKPIATEVTEVIEFRDGKIARLKAFYFDTKAMDDAFTA